MLVKQVNRAATVAWCSAPQHPMLLASGTIAGTIDESFQTNSQLELWYTDLGNLSYEMPLQGSLLTKDCFHKLAWGSKGLEDQSFPLGILAGGMSDGSINLWNPDAILKRDVNKSLIARVEAHKGNVLALEFHPKQPNVLASGATDGEVLIFDLARPNQPTSSSPSNGTKGPGITAIAWNKQVPHILASANATGETCIWDLRQKRTVISFRDSTHHNSRATSLAWHPGASTQIVVSYMNPTPEIWDLRKSISPKIKLENGHTSNVLSASWCPHDSQLLLTSGEDGRALLWRPDDALMLHELPCQGALFDVQWHPQRSGLVSTASYDAKLSIHSVHYTGLEHVPSWLSRTNSASFGFGGKLAQLQAHPAVDGQKPQPQSIVLSQLSTEPRLAAACSAFQSAVAAGDLSNFCSHKIAQNEQQLAVVQAEGQTARVAHHQAELSTWKTLRILFENDHRQPLLDFLGYGRPVPNSTKPSSPALSASSVTDVPESDFFDSLQKEDVVPAESKEVVEETPEPVAVTNPAVLTSYSVDESDEADEKIKRALLVGDFVGAVDMCWTANRRADALVLASCGGSDLMARTLDKYVQGHSKSLFRHTVHAIVRQDFESLITHANSSNWQEILGFFVTYTEGTRYRTLCNELAKKLYPAHFNTHATQIPDEETQRAQTAAIVCYLCAANLDRAVALWSERAAVAAAFSLDENLALSAEPSARQSAVLQAVVEKLYIFSQAIKHMRLPISEQAAAVQTAKFTEYAGILSSQGQLQASLRFLSLCSQDQSAIPASSQHELSILLHRVFHALSHPPNTRSPPFPFPANLIPPSPSQQAQQRGGMPATNRPVGAQPAFGQPPVRGLAASNPNPSMPQSGPAPQPVANANAPGPQGIRPLAPPTRPGMPPMMNPAPQAVAPTGGVPPMRPNMPAPSMGPRPGQPAPVASMEQSAQPHTMPPPALNPPMRPGAPNMMPPRPGMPNAGPMHPPPSPSGTAPSQGAAPQPNPAGMHPSLPPPRMPMMPRAPAFQPPPSQPIGDLAGPAQPQPMMPQPHQPQPMMPSSNVPPQSMHMPQPQSIPNQPQPMPNQPQPMPNQPQPNVGQPMNMPPPRYGMPSRPGMPGPAGFPVQPATPQPRPDQSAGAQPAMSAMSAAPMPSAPMTMRPAEPSLPAPSPAMPSVPVAPSTPARPTMPSRPMSMPMPAPSIPMPAPVAAPVAAPAFSEPIHPSSVSAGPVPSPSMPAQPAPAPVLVPSTPTPAPVPAMGLARPGLRPNFAPHTPLSNIGPVSAVTPAVAAAPAAPLPVLSGDAKDLFDVIAGCMSRLEAANISPMDVRKLEDIRKRMHSLAVKLANNELSADCKSKLDTLCQALSGRDYAKALSTHLALLSADWNDNKQWLPAVKSLIQLAQQYQQ